MSIDQFYKNERSKTFGSKFFCRIVRKKVIKDTAELIYKFVMEYQHVS